MAIGDKLFLADKSTLDATKDTVDTTKANLDVVKYTLENTRSDTQSILSRIGALSDSEGTTSIFSYLKNIWYAVAGSNGGSNKKYFTADDVVNKYKSSLIPVQSTSTALQIDVQGSGEIYTLLYNTSSSMSNSLLNYFQVIVDGVTIYDYSLGTTSQTVAGILTRESLIGGGSTGAAYAYVPGSTPMNIYNKTLQISGTTTHSTLMYLPKPLRFESRLQVRAYLNVTTNIVNPGYIYYTYKLD